jgi:hypothetical protein
VIVSGCRALLAFRPEGLVVAGCRPLLAFRPEGLAVAGCRPRKVGDAAAEGWRLGLTRADGGLVDSRLFVPAPEPETLRVPSKTLLRPVWMMMLSFLFSHLVNVHTSDPYASHTMPQLQQKSSLF